MAHRSILNVEVPEASLDDVLENQLPVLEIDKFTYAGVAQAFEENGFAVGLETARRKWTIVINKGAGGLRLQGSAG